MKVGLFTNNYFPIIGGVAHSVASTAAEIRRRGHDAYVFAPRFPGYRDADSQVIRYPSIPLRYKVPYPLFLSSLATDAQVEALKLDLIHSHHPWGIGKHAWKLARKYSIPIVFTSHTLYRYYVHYLPRVLPRSLMVRLIERSATRYMNSVEAVIAPSPSALAHLRNRGVSTTVAIVPTGVNHRELHDSPLPNLRRRYQIQPGNVLLLALSRLALEKNLPDLVRAFAAIRGEGTQCDLVVAGGGPLLESLKRLTDQLHVAASVHFTGTVRPEDCGGFYREADIVLHTSLSEAQGLVPLEAMACGTPVVAMRAYGVADLITSGEDGILTEPNVNSFEAGVRLVLRNERLRSLLSVHALRTSHKYSIDRTTSELLAVYNAALQASTPRLARSSY